jgi:uncharacterized membrane protein YbhN (UPF0104 family)
VKAFSSLALTPRRVLPIVATLILSNIALLGSFLLCAQALGITLGLVDGAIVMLGMLLAALIPVSIGGWGVREGVAVMLMGPTGIPAAAAVAISILFGLAMTVIAVAGGLLWAITPYRNIKAADALKELTTRGNAGAMPPEPPAHEKSRS